MWVVLPWTGNSVYISYYIFVMNKILNDKWKKAIETPPESGRQNEQRDNAFHDKFVSKQHNDGASRTQMEHGLK